MLFKNLLEVFWLYVVYFTVLFISSFFSSKTKVVGFKCFFICIYCCFKTIIFAITWLLFTIFYIDSLLTKNPPTIWSCKTRCKSCSFLFFICRFTTKLSHLGFEPSFMWLCKPLNFALILLFNNLSSSGVPFTYTFIVFPKSLLPHESIIAWFSSALPTF